MKCEIVGATTLAKFTETIQKGFDALSGNREPFTLIQVHGSPASRAEDLEILEKSKEAKGKKVYLIHRPDELLLYPELRTFFENDFYDSVVHMGDLQMGDPVWMQLADNLHVIPHPFMDLSMPKKEEGKFVLGSFTSWGEMRKLEHFFALVDEVSRSSVGSQFSYLIGGTLDGRPLEASDIKNKNVKLKSEFFVPHLNTQLYHLNGNKRHGESSGSLHRGITIPVIFEANGIERTEGLKVLKIDADEKLTKINYKKAADDIALLMKQGLDAALVFNADKAKLNSPEAFAKKLVDNIF